MYLTYSKSLPMFDQHMVQLESDKPEDSKVYVEFQEGFIPLAAKYYAALAPHVVEVMIDKPTIAEGVKEELIEPVVVMEEVTVVDYVDPAPIPVHTITEPVVAQVIVEEVPVVDVVRLDPIPDPAPVVAPAQPVAKKARKTSV
jgi:hypothetical protein